MSSTNTYKKGYVDWPSWAIYLYHHPGYKNYQPPNNITKNGCRWGNWITFPQKIEAIQARVGHITHPIALLRSKDFLAMYKHPDYYKQAILDYLVDKKHTLEQKKIAIYAIAPISGLTLWKVYYQLYKEKKIDFPLFELLVAISLTNHNDISNTFKEITKKLPKEAYAYLEYIIENIPESTQLYQDIKTILANQFPEPWYKYMILSDKITSSHDYYKNPFPFYDIVSDAVRDKKYWEGWRIASDGKLGVETSPYFLMVMEHPQYYYPVHFGSFSDAKDGIGVLQGQGYTREEKSMTLFGMSQLGIFSSYESSMYYAFLIENACEWYRKGQLSVEHLYQLFKCDFPTFYPYPFFILDYKAPEIQKALDKFIAVPTIPGGLKEIAYRIKNGTLATKQEIAYMEGYRAFRKTHFTLYETIPGIAGLE